MICDLAEYYHIYDYMGYSASYIATLVEGLPDNSRTKLLISNSNITLDQLLYASMVDSLNMLVWSKTTDAKNGFNKPDSVVAILTGKQEEKKYKSYESGDEFHKAYAAIAGD